MIQSIDIEIFGRIYQVRGEKDPEYTRRLAAYVDSQMRAIADRSPPSASPLQIAVLTLLHVANEAFEAKEKQGERDEAVKERAEALISRLASTLGESRA